MRNFLNKAMARVSRMNEDSIRSLLRSLAEENDRLETVLDSMLDGIIVCDDSHLPILINKSAERLVPLIATELYDSPLWHSLRDDELAEFFETIMKAEETILDREFTLDTKQGPRIIAISITPLVRDKRITGTLVHIEETTEKRKRESRLRRAENLAALTTLAAGVAHEIKNPLGAISIHVQLLKKALGSATAPAVDRYLKIVDEEINRLNSIVVDFLFAVRPMNITTINDDLNRLVKELADFLRPEAEAADIELRLELDTTLPPIPFDRHFLKQALLNLITNASAAMEHGGSLLLRTGQDGNEARITVKDSGCGIDERNLSKIFEPYYTTKSDGTGLGLTLTYKIVKEHGGDIAVKSKAGFGSEFVVSLPIPQTDQKLITGRCADREHEHEPQNTDCR